MKDKEEEDKDFEDYLKPYEDIKDRTLCPYCHGNDKTGKFVHERRCPLRNK